MMKWIANLKRKMDSKNKKKGIEEEVRPGTPADVNLYSNRIDGNHAHCHRGHHRLSKSPTSLFIIMKEI